MQLTTYMLIVQKLHLFSSQLFVELSIKRVTTRQYNKNLWLRETFLIKAKIEIICKSSAIKILIG